MTLRKLLLALSVFVADAVRDYPFPAPDGKMIESAAVGGEADLRMRPPSCRDCRVFIHGLPESQEEGTYPFVIVRWQEGDIESMEDSKTVLRDTVALILGVHSPRNQEEAGLLCAELLDVLRRAIWKQRILAKCFELVEPLRSIMPEADRQQHHYHMAAIETVWNYTWPPKALEEAGQSQMSSGFMSVESYSEPELALARRTPHSYASKAGNDCAALAWAAKP